MKSRSETRKIQLNTEGQWELIFNSKVERTFKLGSEKITEITQRISVRTFHTEQEAKDFVKKNRNKDEWSHPDFQIGPG